MKSVLEKIFDRLPYHSLENLKFVHMLIVAGVLSMGVLAGYYFFVYEDKQVEYASLEQKKVSTRNKLAKYKKAVSQMDVVVKQVATLEGTLVEKKRQLPLPEEIPDLLNKLSDVAGFLGLQILNFKMGEAKDNDFYKEIPVTITFSGEYYRTAGFFDMLQSLLRLVNISDLKMEIKPAKKIKKDATGKTELQDVDRLQTSIKANTYAYIEGAEVL